MHLFIYLYLSHFKSSISESVRMADGEIETGRQKWRRERDATLRSPRSADLLTRTRRIDNKPAGSVIRQLLCWCGTWGSNRRNVQPGTKNLALTTGSRVENHDFVRLLLQLAYRFLGRFRTVFGSRGGRLWWFDDIKSKKEKEKVAQAEREAVELKEAALFTFEKKLRGQQSPRQSSLWKHRQVRSSNRFYYLLLIVCITYF